MFLLKNVIRIVICMYMCILLENYVALNVQITANPLFLIIHFLKKIMEKSPIENE